MSRPKPGTAAQPVPLAIVLLGAFTSLAAAENPEPLFPTPPASEYSVVREVPFTSGKPVKMDVYRPARSVAAAPLPALIFMNALPGRSFREDPLYTGWAKAATAHGLVAVLPDAAEDFAAGFDELIAHLRSNAGALHIDPERLAVFAASGNVSGALPVVQNPQRTGVKAAIMYYGSGPVTEFRPDLPMLFVRSGLDRPGLNEALDALLAEAILANAPLQLINYPAGHHGFDIRDDTDATREIVEMTFRFVHSATNPGAHAALLTGIPVARAAGAVRRGDFETAVTLFGEQLASRPDDAALRLSYGEALLALGRYTDARAQFEQLKGAGLGRRDLALPAARAALGAGDPEGAIRWLESIPRPVRPRGLSDDPAFASLRERADFQALFD
jgi:acetyl esterase/lipase